MLISALLKETYRHGGGMITMSQFPRSCNVFYSLPKKSGFHVSPTGRPDHLAGDPAGSLQGYDPVRCILSVPRGRQHLHRGDCAYVCLICPSVQTRRAQSCIKKNRVLRLEPMSRLKASLRRMIRQEDEKLLAA